MNPLLALFTDWLQTLSNATLNLDEQAKARLLALDGQQIAIKVTQPPADFTLSIEGDQLHLTPTECGNPQVIISGNIPGLMAALITNGRSGDVSINGDESLLQKLKELFSGYQPDLPIGLTNLVGSQAGEQFLGAAELGLSTLLSFAENIASSVKTSATSNYVDEKGMEHFLDRLEALRLRIDRLNAAIREKEKSPT